MDEAKCECICGGELFACTGILTDYEDKMCMDCRENHNEPDDEIEVICGLK